MSALLDGELDTPAVARACGQWQEDAQVRACWHHWHLIGDVLRSEDLASRPSHDLAFLEGVRARLAQEPVVLAPGRSEPAPAAEPPAIAPRRHAWRGPAAIAAGVMAVAAVLVVTRLPSAPDNGAVLAQSQDAARTALRPVASRTLADAPAPGAAEPSTEPQTLVADGQLIRNARLDRYLAAHKQFSGSSALGAPSGFLRAATAEAPGR